MLLVAAAVGALVTAAVALLHPDAPSRVPASLVWVGVVAGAAAVGLAGTSPTGLGAVDLVLRVAFGGLLPLAASRAGTAVTCWLHIISASTLVIALEAPGAPVALLAAGTFLALSAAGTATPALASVTTAAAVGALAHVGWPVVHGASSAAVVVAAVPVLLSALGRTEPPHRGRILAALSLCVVALGAASVAGAVAALTVRDDIDRAVDLAASGIDELGDQDERARARLLDAAGAFGSAEDGLTVWWARPALLVPGVAQQARALTTMASTGAALARTAVDATQGADVDSVRPRDGRIDLVALARLQGPLDRSVRSLHTAADRLLAVDTAWLVRPLADRLATLRAEVAGALETAELAARAVEVAPHLLGVDRPRRYFVAFQNPAEATANGGFMGNWAEIVADGGQLTLTRSGRSRELTEGGTDPEARRIEGEPEFVEVYGQSAARHWGNINFSPDHPTVSRIIAQLYPESGGDEIDGVIALTPNGLARFLELTGPVQVAGYPEELTADNAARILLHDQYVRFADDDAEAREGFLDETVQVVFDELTDGSLPGPRSIARALGPAVTARHLQLWSRHAGEQALFERIGADGAAARPDGVDSFGITTQNLNGNKIDWFTRRHVEYELLWDPETGEVVATLTATIRNDAPATGLPRSVIGWGGDESLGQRPVADGENYLWFTAYASHGIEEITVDGEPVGTLRHRELGHETVRAYLSVPAQSERVVTIRAHGVVGRGSRYVLRPLRQATANADSLTVRVATPAGWAVGGQPAPDRAPTSGNAVTWENAPASRFLVVDVRRPASARVGLDRLRHGG